MRYHQMNVSQQISDRLDRSKPEKMGEVELLGTTTLVMDFQTQATDGELCIEVGWTVKIFYKC